MLVETNSGGTSVHYPVRDATRELVTLVSGIDHPECVAWHQGAVYCGTESGDLLRISPESGEVEVVASTGGFLLGIAFDQAGACVACDTGRAELLRIQASGSVEVIAGSVQGRKLVSPNYPVVASDGTIWATESGSGWDTDNGYLFCVRPGELPRIADEECRRFPNGLALDEGREVMYVVEGRLPGVSRYGFNAGRLGTRTEYVLLPGPCLTGLRSIKKDVFTLVAADQTGSTRSNPTANCASSWMITAVSTCARLRTCVSGAQKVGLLSLRPSRDGRSSRSMSRSRDSHESDCHGTSAVLTHLANGAERAAAKIVDR